MGIKQSKIKLKTGTLRSSFFRGGDHVRKLKKYKPTRFMTEDFHYDKSEADFAVNFIENLCHTKGTWARKKLEYIPTKSTYQVLSADVSNKHGFNTHGVIFDELHTQPNRKLYDVMVQGSGDARMQPLYFLITTAGNNTESICYEVHQKALDIMEGRKHDSTFYPVIFGAGVDADWTNPAVWKKANPSLGETIGIDKVEDACESTRQNPGEENAFRQLRLNQWVKQSIRWMPMEKWDACSFPENPV